MSCLKLGKITDIKTGKLDANAAVANGKYPFFTCSKEPLTIDSYSYDCNCVLVAGNGDLNVKYYNGKFDAYQRTYIIETKDEDRFRIKYIYLIIESKVEELRKQAIGGVIKYIKLENLTNIDVPNISIEEQDRMIEKCFGLKKMIELKVNENKELENLIYSKFYKKFGNILNNDSWKTEKLGDLSEKIMSGNTPKGGSEVYVKKGITFFRSQNVWKNKLVMDDIAFIDEETHKKMIKSSLKHNDLLITKTGRVNTENSSLGRASIYEGEDDQANINGHVYLIRLKNNINPKFVLRILISDQYKNLIRKVCVGGIDKRQLNKEHIENFPIIVPPLNLQNQYIKETSDIEKLQHINEEQINKMNNLYRIYINEI